MAPTHEQPDRDHDAERVEGTDTAFDLALSAFQHGDDPNAATRTMITALEKMEHSNASMTTTQFAAYTTATLMSALLLLRRTMHQYTKAHGSLADAETVIRQMRTIVMAELTVAEAAKKEN